MFDLVTGEAKHIPSTPAVSILISSSAQALLVALVIVPVLLVTGSAPRGADDDGVRGGFATVTAATAATAAAARRAEAGTGPRGAAGAHLGRRGTR
jgi:hypothetical protein